MYEYSSFLTFLVGYDRKISVEFVDLYIILKVITIKRYLIIPEVVVFTGKSKYPFLMYFFKKSDSLIYPEITKIKAEIC